MTILIIYGKGLDTTIIMDKEQEIVVIKEHKTEWQRALFTLANLISLISLIVKVNDGDKYGKIFAIITIFVVFAVFMHYIFGKID